MPFDLKTVALACLAIVIFCGCPKKRQKGTVEVIEFDNKGLYHCRAIQDDAPGLSPNTVIRNDDYLLVFDGSDSRGRAFVYFWPDMSPAKLGYKKKVNAEEDYFIFENYAPGENGYWKDHTNHQPVWEKAIACYTELSFSLRPTLYINGQSRLLHYSEYEARNFSVSYVGIESAITWSFSNSTGTLNPAGLNQERNLIKVVSSGFNNYKLLINGTSWDVVPPPAVAGTWTASVCTNSNSSNLQQWVFNCNGSGSFISPDCSGACTPLTFPFTYTVSGSQVSLTYMNPPNITCGSNSVPVSKPANESYTYFQTSPSDLRLTKDTKVYNLKKQSACQ
jgi:hypothetical protein